MNADPHMRRCPPLLVLLGLLTAPTPGCFPDNTPPAGPSAAPASCGDNRCDFLNEDCVNCPADCPCCAIANSSGTVPNNDAERAEGDPDGQSVALDDQSDLFLVFGREIFDAKGKPDLQLHGQVTSGEPQPASSAGCPQNVSGHGAFEIAVSADGVGWQTIGLWSRSTIAGPQVAQFNIACVELTTVRWVRVKAQPGAAGQLDAVTGISTGDNPSCRTEQVPQ